MTIQEIIGYFNRAAALESRDVALPLWEIAYQLAKQNEQKSRIEALEGELEFLRPGADPCEGLGRPEPAKKDPEESAVYVGPYRHHFTPPRGASECFLCGLRESECKAKYALADPQPRVEFGRLDRHATTPAAAWQAQLLAREIVATVRECRNDAEASVRIALLLRDRSDGTLDFIRDAAKQSQGSRVSEPAPETSTKPKGNG